MENQGNTSPYQVEESMKRSLDQAESLLNHCMQNVKDVCLTWNRIVDEIKRPKSLKLNMEEFVQIQQSDRKKAIRFTLTADEHNASQEYNAMKTEFNHLMLFSVSVTRNQTKFVHHLLKTIPYLHEFNVGKRAAEEELLKLRNTYRDELKKLDDLKKIKDDEIAKLRLDLKNATVNDCNQNSDLALNNS